RRTGSMPRIFPSRPHRHEEGAYHDNAAELLRAHPDTERSTSLAGSPKESASFPLRPPPSTELRLQLTTLWIVYRELWPKAKSPKYNNAIKMKYPIGIIVARRLTIVPMIPVTLPGTIPAVRPRVNASIPVMIPATPRTICRMPHGSRRIVSSVAKTVHRPSTIDTIPKTIDDWSLAGLGDAFTNGRPPNRTSSRPRRTGTQMQSRRSPKGAPMSQGCP